MIIFLISLFFQVQALELVGEAKDLKSQSLVYREYHQIDVDKEGYNHKITTIYKKLDGKEFARMSTDFSKSKNIPDIIFEDLRFQRKEELIYDPSQKKIRIRKTVNGKTETKEFSEKTNMIAGQGFDNFVRNNFGELSKKEIPIHFIVLTRLDYYRFQAFPNPTQSESVAGFGLKIGSFLLKMFADNIYLEYDKKTKQLVSYKGLSNLSNDEDKNWYVDIKYTSK